MPERGFTYFRIPPPDPNESDSDKFLLEGLLYEVQLCQLSVVKWMSGRTELVTMGSLDPEQCDHIEKLAIATFREFAEKVLAMLPPWAGVTLPLLPPERSRRIVLEVISQPWFAKLYERLMCAHAFLALYADPATMKPFVYSDGECHARESLWLRLIKAHADIPDKFRSQGRFNEWLFTGGDPSVLRSKKQGQQHEKRPLTEMEEKFVQGYLRSVGLNAGMVRRHIPFLAEMVLNGATQADNPTAYKNVYRNRLKLPAELRCFLFRGRGSFRGESNFVQDQ